MAKKQTLQKRKLCKTFHYVIIIISQNSGFPSFQENQKTETAGIDLRDVIMHAENLDFSRLPLFQVLAGDNQFYSLSLALEDQYPHVSNTKHFEPKGRGITSVDNRKSYYL